MGAEASVPMEVNEADVSWVAAPGGKSGVGVVRWRSKVLHASPLLRAPHPARAAHLLRQWKAHEAKLKKHPHVLKIVGVLRVAKTDVWHILTEPYTKVMELPLMEDLAGGKRGVVPLYSRLEIAHQVAQVVALLHQCDIVHGALTLDQVVMTDRGFKVKGIGWNWVQDEEADPLYLPPEAMDRMSKQDLGHTKEADIFALGYLLGELYTNRSVRDVFLSEPQFKDASGKPDKALWKKHVVLHKFSPVQEHDVNKQMSKLLTSCWKRDTDKRPSAQEALDMLTEAILEKVLRNRFARTIWQAALDKQYEFNRSEANPFEVKWQHFAWAFYVKHMGLKMPKPKNIPPKRYHLRFTEILGLLFIHELLTRDEDDESKRLSTLLLSGSGSGIGGSAVRDKKKEKKKKKKSDNDLLSAKGINVQAASRGELRGIVPLDDFSSFLLWFPLLGPAGDTTLLKDVVHVMGHRFFQAIRTSGEAVRLLNKQPKGTFLMRFSGEPGSFSISYVLDFVSKPSPRTELRHLRFSRLPEGRFAVVINNRTESFASLDELRKALVRQSAVCLEKEYVKQSGSSLDELRALWSMVEEDPDELEDLGYRPIITYATAKTSSEAAVAAGLKEGQVRETIEELEGILTYKGKARLVSIRQGVLMIYSLNEDGKGSAEALVGPLSQSVGGLELVNAAELRLSLRASGALVESSSSSTPAVSSSSSSLSVSSSNSSASVSPRPSTSGIRSSSNEALLSKIRTGRHHPHKVVVLDGAAVTELKGEMSFRLECNGWVGVLSCDSVPATAKWITCISHWSLQGKRNRYSSFRPPHASIPAQWYVDGEDTYEAIADAIESARNCIFVADWFLIIETYLRRKHPPSIHNRFDKMILKKAQEGVHIYVLLYFEVNLALKLNSQATERKLANLHPNIHIIRHPRLRPFSWSHHQKIVVVDYDTAFVGGLDLCFGRWDRRDHPVADPCHLATLWPGRDYYNPELEGLSNQNVENPFVETLDRNKQPRMPWHDIHMRVGGEAARDVALNFIQRWNHHRDKKNETMRAQVPYLLPSVSPPQTPAGTCECQVVRSLSDWSGCNRTEDSIAQAYYELIEGAQYFVYIENQFFISSTAGSAVQNRVAQALVNRIIRAHKEKEVFRVIIILPNFPEGSFFAPEVRMVMKWTYETICRGDTSLLAQLQRAGVNIPEYISFHQLRSWGHLDQGPVSNQVYVHCKCMIVDDVWTVIGSANINDRSMLGVRDSEVAIITRDKAPADGKMNGRNARVSSFAQSLRISLWREHLGLLGKEGGSEDALLLDPIHANTFHGLWRRVSQNNTTIHCQVFANTPSDEYKTLKDYSRALERREANPISAREVQVLEGLKGQLLDLPLLFLSEENLGPSASDVALKVLDSPDRKSVV